MPGAGRRRRHYKRQDPASPRGKREQNQDLRGSTTTRPSPSSATSPAAPSTPRSWRTAMSATSCRLAVWPPTATRSPSSVWVSTLPAATPRFGPTSRCRDRPGSPTRLDALADEIQATISFGLGRKNRADDAPADHPLFDLRRLGGAAAPCRRSAAQQGARATRHRRQRQPLRRRLRRRARRHLGRRALWQPRPRPHDRVWLSRDVARRKVGRARARTGGAALALEADWRGLLGV